MRINQTKEIVKFPTTFLCKYIDNNLTLKKDTDIKTLLVTYSSTNLKHKSILLLNVCYIYKLKVLSCKKEILILDKNIEKLLNQKINVKICNKPKKRRKSVNTTILKDISNKIEITQENDKLTSIDNKERTVEHLEDIFFNNSNSASHFNTVGEIFNKKIKIDKCTLLKENDRHDYIKEYLKDEQNVKITQNPWFDLSLFKSITYLVSKENKSILREEVLTSKIMNESMFSNNDDNINVIEYQDNTNNSSIIDKKLIQVREFYQILLDASNNKINVTQNEPYGEIIITSK